MEGQITSSMELHIMINFLNIREHFPQYHEDKSHWAYQYCKNIKDSPEIAKLITNPSLSYYYCHCVRDDKKIALQITSSGWAYSYCLQVKDRPEVRRYITEKLHLDWYKNWKKKQ